MVKLLFDAHQLQAEQIQRNVKVGTAASVTRSQWAAAETCPNAAWALIHVTDDQRHQLALFS